MAQVTLVAAWLTQSPTSEPRIPLGVLYLAGELQRNGHNVKISDCQLQSSTLSANDVILNTLQGSSKIVGISCMSDLMPAVLLAATAYKMQSPETTIILGGPGPASVAKSVLLNFPAVDYIVTGEGEITLCELVSAVQKETKVSAIKGLCYRDNNGFVQCTEPRSRIENLDRLHPLPYSAISFESYASVSPISTSRGCTYGCSFCDVNGIWQRQVTRRTIEGVLQELNYLWNYGRAKIAIVDDTFILDRNRVNIFCQFLRDAQLPISWHCNARINLIDKPLLSAMAEAGCQSLFFGVESGSNLVLKRIHKAFNTEQVESAIRLAARYMPMVTASFIWGFPFESWEDFQQTREIYLSLAEIDNVQVQIYKLTPFSHSPLYQEFAKTLYFDSTLVSDLNGRHHLSPLELDLVEKHPHIFPNYYNFPTENMPQKLEQVMKDQVDINNK